MGVTRRSLRRWTARSAVLTLGIATLAAAHVATAPTALAAPVPYTVAVATPSNSTALKLIAAWCRPGDRVVGGDAWIGESGTPTNRVAFTKVAPFQLTTNQDGYEVAAAETAGGTNGSWRIEAYANCLSDPNNLLGLEGDGAYPGALTPWNSQSVKTAAAVCPAGRVALGTGARINGAGDGQAVLQVSRPSGPGDISRAQAQETPGATPATGA